MAYALLQPGDAHRILTPVLGIGESFREFFGAIGNVTSEPILESQEIDQINRDDVPDATTALQLDQTPEEHVSRNVASIEDIGGPSKETVVPYVVLRTESVRKAFHTLQTHRAVRQLLGAAHLLDESAFKAEHDLELDAQAHVRNLNQDFRGHWEATTQRYVTLAQEYGVSLSVEACPVELEPIAESLAHLEIGLD